MKISFRGGYSKGPCTYMKSVQRWERKGQDLPNFDRLILIGCAARLAPFRLPDSVEEVSHKFALGRQFVPELWAPLLKVRGCTRIVA